MKDGYAICFNEWALDPTIKNDLRLLIIISSLSAEKGYCYASNKYLAELFSTTEETISRKIKNLENKKYIDIEYGKRGSQVISRKIRLTKISMDDYQKYQRTIDENIKENNTSNNNTRINNIYIVEQVIDYLNEVTGSKYKSATRTTRDKINARLNEGFTVEDFKTVIDKKAKEWGGTAFEQYLRPETLFGTKFESYLNQKEVIRKETTSEKMERLLREAQEYDRKEAMKSDKN